MNIKIPILKVRIGLSDLKYVFKSLPKIAEIKAPYFSQFMSAEMVEDFIEGRKELHTDPNWKFSGAKNADEYASWTWCDCGIACLKMILTAKNKSASSVGLVSLAKEAQEYGAFKIQANTFSPLHYAEFCTFLGEQYGLKAQTTSALSVSTLKEQVANGNFTIISVHPSIRHTDALPPKRGGHLVLVVGYDEKGMYIHNPSGYKSNSSQERAFIPYKDFKRFFAYRGIIIKNN